MRRHPAVFTLIFLAFTFPLISGCGQRIANQNSKGEAIICFGNSLTEGVGADPGGDFPSLLAKKVKYPVINAGKKGETTRDALRRLNQDVLAKNPKLVIVEFGSNDFLQKIPQEETFKNLDDIVAALTHGGAMVVLVEVRIGLFFDEYYSGFKMIARRRGALLVTNILSGIFNNPNLKSDNLHPNAQGYSLIAERLYRAIAPLLNPS